MGVFRNWYRQKRKPEGMFGKMAASGMNRSNTKVADWGIDHLEDFSPRVIVDLGCGGGGNAKNMLKKFPNAKLLGLDHSEAAVEVAKSVNKQAVSEKRCLILEGDVCDLPFRDGVADLVTAFDTVCFWDDPEKGMKEADRVLKSGGIFLIVNSNDGIPNEEDVLTSAEKAGMTKGELCTLLKAAGFAGIGVDHDRERHRLCILCQK